MDEIAAAGVKMIVLVNLGSPIKPQLARFAGGLIQEEIRSAAVPGLTGFVTYPTLPNPFVDPRMILIHVRHG